MTEQIQYISEEEAAQLISPGFSSEPRFITTYHIRIGKIKPIYANAILVDEQGQQVNKGYRKRIRKYNKAEVLAYVESMKVTAKRGSQREIKVTRISDKVVLKFESIVMAAKILELSYHMVYRALRKGKETGGYKFEYAK